MRQIPGLENARMFRPGYAVEYDFFHRLNSITPSKQTPRKLYFAGQINGTTDMRELPAKVSCRNQRTPQQRGDPFTGP